MLSMDHVAIMKKSWHLLPKILSGEKTIESRWYMHRCEAWGKVSAGDTVFFKNSGEPVTVHARVKKVLQFEHLAPAKVRSILEKYGGRGGIGNESFGSIWSWAKRKTYCVLVFLEHPSAVQPFRINKMGFGSAAAWLCVGRIASVKR